MIYAIFALLALGILMAIDWATNPILWLAALGASYWRLGSWQSWIALLAGIIGIFSWVASQISFGGTDAALIVVLGAGPGALLFIMIVLACRLTWRMFDPEYFRMEPR